MRRVWCYPIQFSTPCPRLPTIEFLQEREQALLRYHGDTLPINTTHLQKLVNTFLKMSHLFFEICHLQIFISIAKETSLIRSL